MKVTDLDMGSTGRNTFRMLHTPGTRLRSAERLREIFIPAKALKFTFMPAADARDSKPLGILLGVNYHLTGNGDPGNWERFDALPSGP